jgi:3-dehydroquinate dehydratase-2
MSMRIAVVNGPNLNLLGQRQPEVYGYTTLQRLERLLVAWARPVGAEISHFQSNHEGAVIDHLHGLRGQADGVLLNPGAFTHYSRALADAVASVEIPTVEVHISNVMEREQWRRRSVVSSGCVCTIYGRGVEGYLWGIRHLHYRQLGNPQLVISKEGAPGDLRVPDGEGPHPVVVLFHGGGWMAQWRRDQLDGMAVDLSSQGYATYNFEYLPPHQGGRFPVTIESTRQAYSQIASHPKLDSNRVALVGHSAGGTLALTAARWWRRWGHAPILAVSLAGVTTLRPDSPLDRAYLKGQDLRAASPRHLLPLGVDTLLIHAQDDDIVSPDQSSEYGSAAAAAGDNAQTVILNQGGHLGFLDVGNRAWMGARERIMSAFPP